MKNVKSLKELLEQYKVTADYSSIDSNLVYPLDKKEDYTFHGYINDDDVKPFIEMVKKTLELDGIEKYLPSRIANKYAIPYLQVGHMHTIETFFYYQHDKKTWMLSRKEKTDEYLG